MIVKLQKYNILVLYKNINYTFIEVIVLGNETINRVGCYVRVSTENQLENYSIEEQTERLKAYCRAKGWNIYKIYTDGGYSGGNTDRPALKQMLSDAEARKIDMVVVYKLDRLSRSQKDTLSLIEDFFIANNVEFTSMSENFDTSTPFGRAMIGILSVFAQLEKDQITERFTMGRIGRAKEGKFHGGAYAPVGYDYVDGELVINEYEAMQIKEIFSLFVKGYNVNQIQKILQNNNYKNKYSNWNSHRSILNCLRNATYTGKVKFKGQSYNGSHDKIISEDVFLKAQSILNSKEREDNKTNAQKRPFKAMYLLSNSLRCARCGAKYSAAHGKYKCYSRSKTAKKYITDPNCMNDFWDISKLDEAVKSELYKLKVNDNYFNSIIKIDSTTVNDDNAVLVNRIKEIDMQISRILDLYQVGSIPIGDINKRINKLQQEKEALESKCEKKPLGNTVEQFKNILNTYDKVFANGSLEEQRMFITLLVKEIKIDGNRLIFEWNI